MFWGGNKSDLECGLGRTEGSCEIDLEFVLFGVLFKVFAFIFIQLIRSHDFSVS